MKILRVTIAIGGAALAVSLLLFGCFGFGNSGQVEAREEGKSRPGPQIKYVVPSRSPLQLSISTELDHLLYFDGAVEIAARYRFVYEQDSEGTNNPFLIISPDKHSMELLPYLPGNGEKGYPSEIYIRNPDVAAESMFDKQFRAKLMNGSFPLVDGEAVFTIRGYWVGYECDRPTFAARVVTVKRVREKRSHESQGQNSGC